MSGEPNESTTMSVLAVTTCVQCEKVMETLGEYCTCTEDPYSAVNVLEQIPELRVTLIVYTLSIILGIVANVLILVAMIKSPERKAKTATNIFLISLAVADLLLVLVAAPMELVHYFSRQFDKDGHACKFAEYSRVLVAFALILNLLAVTVERFIVIVLPVKSRMICTLTNCKRSLVLVWILAFILAIPVPFTKGVYHMHYGDNDTLVSVNYCNDFDDNLGFLYTVYQLIVAFAVPALVMIVCYSVVIKELWKSTKTVANLTNQNNPRGGANRPIRGTHNCSPLPSTRANQSRNPNFESKKARDVKATRKQVIKMLLCVVILFLLCWGPRFVLELLLKLQLDVFFSPTVYWIRVVLFLFPFVHAVLNPIIYFVMSKNIRDDGPRSRREGGLNADENNDGDDDDDDDDGDGINMENRTGSMHVTVTTTCSGRTLKITDSSA